MGSLPIPFSKEDAMSIKAFQYRLYANKQTTEKLQWVLDRCRELYNAGLQERRDAYEIGVRRHPGYYDEETRKQLTREHAIGYYEQKRELVDIKEERPEYQDIASHVLQDVIMRVTRAYDGSSDVYKTANSRDTPDFRAETATTHSVTLMGQAGN
jgi:putative transposase